MIKRLINQPLLPLLLAAVSSALLGGAWLFEAIGIAPCKMCYWQRYPHMIAPALGVLFWAMPNRILAWLGCLSMLVTAAIGLFHSGVERGFWEGPSSCTSSGVAGIAPEDLLTQILEAPLVRCDEIAWQLLGLTMANYNALLSLGLAALWVGLALRRP